MTFVVKGSPDSSPSVGSRESFLLHVLRDGELSIRSRSPVEAAGAR
jgi:hypothetical protein